MSRLTSYVHVHLPQGGTVVYGPDDEVPAEHAELIGNPKAWVGGSVPEAAPPHLPPATGGDESVPGPARTTVLAENPLAQAEPDHLPVPPRSGPGSGTPAWAEYATAHGVDIEDGAGRNDIIAALTAQGVPVE